MRHRKSSSRYDTVHQPRWTPLDLEDRATDRRCPGIGIDAVELKYVGRFEGAYDRHDDFVLWIALRGSFTRMIAVLTRAPDTPQRQYRAGAKPLVKGSYPGYHDHD